MDTNKITEEELKSLQTAVYNINQAKTVLGDLSTQVHKAQLQVLSMEKIMSDTQKLIEEKYGSIVLDLKTGEYTVEE